MHCPRDSFESIALDYLGDCIGVESCLDLKTNVDLGSCCGVQKSHHHSHRRRRRGNGRISSDQWMQKPEKEFPPPIPWLALNEKMPWIMKRYYTNDGRLIIRREKVKRREYFLADRSNGRLTLRLVPVNYDELDGDDDHCGDSENGFLDSEVGSDRMDGYDGDREDEQQPALEEEPRILDRVAAGLCMENAAAVAIGGIGGGGGGAGAGGGGGELYKYCSMSRSSWMLGEMAVAAISSVHT